MGALLDIVKKGSVDRSVTLRIIDSTDGTPETGVVFNTAGLAIWYRREGEAIVDITEVTLASLTTAHTDGGFLHIRDGEYRVDLPDAAFAAGANHVDVGGACTGMIVLGGRVRMVDFDLESASVPIQTVLKRNQAVTDWSFFMTSIATHDPAPGLSPLPVVSYSHDGGATWVSLGSATEGGDGFYKITLTAAAMNNPVVTIKATAAGADFLPVQLLTAP